MCCVNVCVLGAGHCASFATQVLAAYLVVLTAPVNVLQTSAGQHSLALLCICDTLVLDRAHTQHLRNQPVELIKATPGACSNRFGHHQGWSTSKGGIRNTHAKEKVSAVMQT